MTVTHTLFDDSQMSFTIILGFWINHRLLWTLKLPMSAVLAGMQSIQFCARSQEEAAEAETVTYLFVFFSQWLMSRGAACAADWILLTEAAFIKERPVFETEMRILYSPPQPFPFRSVFLISILTWVVTVKTFLGVAATRGKEKGSIPSKMVQTGVAIFFVVVHRNIVDLWKSSWKARSCWHLYWLNFPPLARVAIQDPSGDQVFC